MHEQFSATLETIYGAANEATRWPAALAAIEGLTGSAGAVMHIVPRRSGGSLKTLLGTSAKGLFIEEHLEEWTRDYASMCPRLAAPKRYPDAPYIVDYMLLTEREMDRDPVYSWYRRYGLRYFIGSTLCRTVDSEVVWSLQRSAEQGHAQSSDIQVFELLKAHLARAVGLADQLGTLGACERFSSALIEALPQAVFALDAKGVLLFANGAARRLLAEADGLAAPTGRLMTAAAGEQHLLDATIRSAIAPLSRSSGGWIRISRPSGRLPLAIFVSPFHVGEELSAPGGKVLVIAHDTAGDRSADAEMLAAVLGLTEAEARLASALSAGHSVESASSMLGMQPSTARGHLKSVFRKTGVNRQQDLVRLLACLSTVGPSADQPTTFPPVS